MILLLEVSSESEVLEDPMSWKADGHCHQYK